MIDFSKIEQGQFWNNWDRPPRASAERASHQTSITRPESNAVATTQSVPTTPATQGGGTTMPATNYTGYMPSQWQTANDAYTRIANANPMSWGSWYDKAKQTAQYDINDAIRQAVETAGMGGMRWSDSLGRTGQDIAARTMAGLGSQYAANEMQGYQQNISNQLGAAQGLQGLGQQYAYLPMDVANNMMNMGQGMQNAYNQEINPFYNLWNSQQPYNSPWLQNALMLAQSSQPQQYQPSGLSQGFDAITSLLPFWFLK